MKTYLQKLNTIISILLLTFFVQNKTAFAISYNITERVLSTKNKLSQQGDEIDMVSNIHIEKSLTNPDWLEAILYEKNLDRSTFYLFSHGRTGELLLNNQWHDTKEIVAWLKETGYLNNKTHLNIYGCEFAKGEKGKQAVQFLEEKLNITIAASDDITGKDGDWDLEIGTSLTSLDVVNYQYNLQNCCNGTHSNGAGGHNHVKSLTLKYTGSPGNIILDTDDGSGGTGLTYITKFVQNGETVIFAAAGSKKYGSNSDWSYPGGSVSLHTSCSRNDVVLGATFGPFEILGIITANGCSEGQQTIGNPPCSPATNNTNTASINALLNKNLLGSPTGGTWSIVSGGGSISGNTYTAPNVSSNTNVTIRYSIATNGSCPASSADKTFTITPNTGSIQDCCHSNQPQGHMHPKRLKLKYIGSGTVNIVFRFKDSGGAIHFSGSVPSGGGFTVDGTGMVNKHGQEGLETDTWYSVNGSSGSFHTSCSQNLDVGDIVNGLFEVLAIEMPLVSGLGGVSCTEGTFCPDAGTNGTLSICSNNLTTTALFNALGGNPTSGGTWSPALNGVGTYTYTHPASNGCPAASSQVVVSTTTGIDSDSDGIPNICDLDDDNDGILDTDECIGQVTLNPNSSSSNYLSSGHYSNYNSPALNSNSGWAAANENPNQFVGMLFGGSYQIVGITTRSYHNYDEWIKTYRLEATKNGSTWVSLGNFNGNTTTNTPVFNSINNSDNDWTGLRIVPLTWNKWPSIRFQFTLISCDEDGDGIPNDLDLDSDNDGCSDAVEGGANFTTSNTDANDRLTGSVDANGIPIVATSNGQTVGSSQNANVQDPDCSNPCDPLASGNLDSDNDGLTDICDLDDDNDGILDNVEGNGDDDNDNIINSLDLDSDGDGCPDAIEGGANFTYSDLDANDRLTGNVDVNGIPIVATSTGQTMGSSQNAAISVCPEICGNGIDDDGDGLTDCADPDCGINASATSSDETCSQNNGSITISFSDNPNQTDIEFSINGGSTWNYTTPDNAGTFAINNLSAGTYDLRARWADNTCPITIDNNIVITNNGTPTACNPSILFQKSVNVDTARMNETVIFTFTITNSSGASLNNVSFIDNLPNGGLFFSEPTQIVNGIQITGQTTSSSSANLTLFNVPVGISSFQLAVDIPSNLSQWSNYCNQAKIGNLKASNVNFPDEIPSDNPATPVVGDPTCVIVKIYENCCNGIDDDGDGLCDEDDEDCN